MFSPTRCYFIWPVVFALSVGVQAQTKSRDVSIGLQAAITSMDPHFHNLSPNNAMSLHIFEPLIKRDEKPETDSRSCRLLEGA